jgi:probable O-glycosylation ligase (exosortase A-associated)
MTPADTARTSTSGLRAPIAVAAPRSARRASVPAKSRRGAAGAGTWPYWLLVTFLVIEYARPPLIYHLRLQMIIIVVMPLLWLRAKERPWSRILTAQLLFLLWTIKSLPNASNWYAVYFHARILFGLISISLALSWIGADLKRFRSIIWLWVSIMVYQGCFALAHGGRGYGGFVGDENELALAVSLAIPFCFFGFERLRARAKWLCLIGMVILVGASVASMSRGGFLALVGVAGSCWLASRHKQRALVVLFAGAVIMLIAVPQSYVNEIKSIRKTHEGTAEGREFLWTAAWNMFKAHPILGVGAGNATFLVGKYQPTDFSDAANYQDQDWSGTQIHSVYFQGLAEHAVIGMAIWASIAFFHFATLKRIRRRRDMPPEARRAVELFAPALSAAMVGYLIAGAFISVGYYPYYFYLSALAVALEAAVEREVRQRRPASA